MFINKSLNGALKNLLEIEDKLICLGEDISDPYGGAFKVTKGLSDSYPEKVISTPVSEAAIIGVGTGLSMLGYKPIIEIMFGDFILLGADQIINYLSKFYSLHNHLKPTSVVIRTPMGGGRGYGPTHSQSLANIFNGYDGLTLVTLNIFTDAGKLLTESVYHNSPVIFIENKSLYGQPNSFNAVPKNSLLESNKSLFPVIKYCTSQMRNADFSLVTYGGMSKIGYEVLNRLYENEQVVGEMIVPSCISDFSYLYDKKILSDINFLITLEESHTNLGFGSEVVSRLKENLSLKHLRIGKTKGIIPNSRKLEDKVLPTVNSVYHDIVKFLERNLM